MASSSSRGFGFAAIFLFLSIVSSSAHVSLLGEDLIRALNLFPHHHDGGTQPTPYLTEKINGTQKGGIVETTLRFPRITTTSSSPIVSSQELGHYSGYYNIANSHAARMFYFFFESRSNKSDPLVIWLTGGPGCSSELALFYENGPFKINSNMSLTWNDYGWDKVSNIIFVDQPTGTGFSYSSDERDIRTGEEGVSNDLYDFLQAFFAEHPQYENNDFYITGESYAGHYIPALAERIDKGNKAREGTHINLKGFAIGNGLTDPAIQFRAYADYAFQNKIIGESLRDELIQSYYPPCEEAIGNCAKSGGEECLSALDTCEEIFSRIIYEAGRINYYDIRKKCYGEMCYDFSNLEKYMNLDSVKRSLHVGDIDFVSCSSSVQRAMRSDYVRDFDVGIPALIDSGIKLLVYAGEYDLICNWLGNSRWVQSMKWSGQKDFLSAQMKPFLVEGGKEAGLLQTYGPLSFMKVHDSGHMVPMDQPAAALEMLSRWTRGTLVDQPSFKYESPIGVL